MLKVIVDRSKWLRGEGAKHSYLRRPDDGKMCCLGFACLAAGATVEQITDRRRPDEDEVPPVLVGYGLEFLPSGKHTMPTQPIDSMMATNDDGYISDAEREADLIRLGSKVGIAFRFIDGHAS